MEQSFDFLIIIKTVIMFLTAFILKVPLLSKQM